MGSDYISVDEGTGTKIATHLFTEDSVTKEIERVAPGVGVVTVNTTADISESTASGELPASAIDCQGKARLVLKFTYSATTTSCAFRVGFYDSAGTLIGYSDKKTVGNTGLSDGGSRYMGQLFVIANECGAATFKLYFDDAPANGNVSVFVGLL